MNKPVHVNNVLKQWDELYTAKESEKPKIDRAKPLRVRSGAGGAKRQGSLASARAALAGIARKSPQAIVKITGGGRGSQAVLAHLRYISRNGELPLEDQDGQRHEGKFARLDIIERWEYAGMPRTGKYREAFNIVLSSPRGSDAAAVHQAARDFAREQFGGKHDYVMALHCPETDPSARKTENAHIHLVVKARSYQGVRLNPRKADLFSYRQAYARHMRANGIDVIAVRREALFNTRTKGVKQSIRQLSARGALRPKVTQPGAVPHSPAAPAKFSFTK